MPNYSNFVFGTIREIKAARYWKNNEGFSQEFIVDDSFVNKDNQYVQNMFCVVVHNARVNIPVPDASQKYAVEVQIRCRERSGQNGAFWDTSLECRNIMTLEEFYRLHPECAPQQNQQNNAKPQQPCMVQGNAQQAPSYQVPQQSLQYPQSAPQQQGGGGLPF